MVKKTIIIEKDEPTAAEKGLGGCLAIFGDFGYIIIIILFIYIFSFFSGC